MSIAEVCAGLGVQLHVDREEGTAYAVLPWDASPSEITGLVRHAAELGVMFDFDDEELFEPIPDGQIVWGMFIEEVVPDWGL